MNHLMIAIPDTECGRAFQREVTKNPWCRGAGAQSEAWRWFVLGWNAMAGYVETVVAKP